MTQNDLTTDDLKNIRTVLSNADVRGVQQAAALLVLHNKVSEIIKAVESGTGSGGESDKPGTDESPAD